MKKVFLGINVILLWITIWHFYKFPITENMSLSLHNKKVYRRLIPNTIDPIVKSSDLLFNINFGGEEQDDAGRAYVKGLMKNRDAWIGYVYSFDEIMEESPAYASNPPNGDELAVKEYVNKHSGYFYVTSNEMKYHLTKEEIVRKFNLKKLSLKNPRFFVDKIGTDRELSNWNKYSYKLPQSKLKDEKDIKDAKKNKKEKNFLDIEFNFLFDITNIIFIKK
ncbi:hypothetical protein JCM16775_1824 [Leptotrichia hofstadii]|uniref:Uncharacterized protein n=1 Tax=Leptotrichia hofstadii TaxID=157688 RepID=A0A510JMZ3_9FUSO|nr:hypothetical protein [Leptotrichia hofstadii]BBM39113.1 hypothetical protein JCM16775_1824 [Leptotrichia hofstadii]